MSRRKPDEIIVSALAAPTIVPHVSQTLAEGSSSAWQTWQIIANGHYTLTPVPAAETVWSKNSWRRLPALHQPTYADDGVVRAVVARLAELPPLVSVREIERLKRKLRDAEAGRLLVLQGGDCAETVREASRRSIEGTYNALVRMSIAMTASAGKEVLCMGRCAGQYAKPRSSPTETRGEVTLPSYVGDLVNDVEFSASARAPDPNRLLLGYEHAALTLNYLRSLASPTEDFFTCHEGLHLEYEAAQINVDARSGNVYDFTTHMPWIGDRTRRADEAHVELFRGVANPVGVKVGPTADPDDLLATLIRLNPTNESGKLVVITRMGAKDAHRLVTRIASAIAAAERRVSFLVDPMHGNTRITNAGSKSRDLAEMCAEIVATAAAHREIGTTLSGLHDELAGSDVTECVGAGVAEADLARNYETLCDPRLNLAQAEEMAHAFGRALRQA